MVVKADNARIMLTLPKELKDHLERDANKENRSLSNFIVTLLQKYAKEAAK